MTQLDAYLERIELRNVDADLLEQALIHRSYVHEQWELALRSNERLEFLGDSVLNLVTAHFLYTTYPDKGEGELTALRSALVRAATLARWAREIDLGSRLKLGKGEEQSGGRNREPLLADAFEALVGAIFLSGELAAADRFLRPFLGAEATRIVAAGLVLDEKSRLQERIQAERNSTPRYRTVLVEGPDHDRQFTIEVWAGDERLGVGMGTSKQAAAQAAARTALRRLDQRTDGEME